VSGARPGIVVLVAGTGTEVGKTWVSARLLEHWRAAGLAVCARKPAQSFAAGEGLTDAEVLAAAAGESPVAVCPPERSYELAMAPPMAAEVLGRPPFSVAELARGLAWPSDGDVGLVESAGGLRSPLAADGDTVDLLGAIRPDVVVLVADAGLGTINAVRLCLDALDGASTVPALVVVLNRFCESEPLHGANLQWLRTRAWPWTVPSTPASLRQLAEEISARRRPRAGGSAPGIPPG